MASSVTSTSLAFATAGIAPPYTAHSSILYLLDKPVVTVSVPADIQQGITVSPGNEVVKPGADATTISKLVFSVQSNPAQILFQTAAVPEATSEASRQSASASVTTSPIITESPSAIFTSNGLPITPSTSSSAPAQRGSNDNGLSGGAVAGVAIGCLIAGVLIAGILFWLCCGKRSRSRNSDSETSALALTSYDKQPTSKITFLSGGSTSTDTPGGSFPQPLEDKAISGDISKIGNAIKNHVQSYYHTSRVSPALIDNEDIQALGPNMPMSTEKLLILLGNAATREIALRFCIAWVIVPRMQSRQGQLDGFLPTEVSKCLMSITSVDDRSKTRIASITRWRLLTAELMQSAYIRNAFTASDSRHASVGAAVRVLDNVLQPYADSRMDNEQRKRNLEEIVKRSALFAFTLFSQPSLWDFEWEGESSGELCVFPALVQIADETGEVVRPPRPFSEAVVRRLEA